MPQKLKPTSGQKSKFFIHLIVFLIATVAMFMIHHNQGKEHWAYPWHAWIIAAWGLAVLGHWSLTFAAYADPKTDEYKRQSNNG